ncbi:MAG: hypoxanthine phosphoribosyltransferase [Clostridia bacterium]|nr:hypoxanthine phosphoribosyltransferase [Clostridia bacterium]
MRIHEDIKEIMFTKQELDLMVHNIAARINDDFANEELVAVIILKGSVMFAADLIRCLTMNVKMDFMQASSYGSGTVSSGNIDIKKDIDGDIRDKNVLIIEDIVDSGRTLSLIKDEMKKRGAKRVAIASLLSKPSRRTHDVEVEYIGTDIPDEFVVGYGLDMDEKYRQLDYIGILKPEVYM